MGTEEEHSRSESVRPEAPGGGSRGAGSGTLLGAVFCGGRSRRMGLDKALLRFGDAALIEHAIAALAPLTGTPILAVGAVDRYREFGGERVLDRAPDLGPLAGLEAVLAKATERGADAVCVLACDMPAARTEDFEKMVALLAERDADLCLARSPRGIEPLFGVYRSRLLPRVRSALDRDDRSLRSIHAGARVVFADLEDGGRALNLNTCEDVEKARTARFGDPQGAWSDE
ncbi:MAG TPA: molybdenum cofactor guanylyltransferase [Planctomycetes bacterium]|nr:molybdenum cofactor guanylyltransferase [Planctomycetota bacterium]